MKRFTLAAAILAIVGLIIWWLGSTDRSAERAAQVPGPTPTIEAPSVAAPTLAAEDSSVAPREVVQTLPEAHASEPASTPTPAETFDPNARGWIHLIVRDPQGAPIANAEIRMTRLRSASGLVTEWNWRDSNAGCNWTAEPSLARTAIDGSARLWYPKRRDVGHPTSQVGFVIQHPEFMTLEQDGFDVDPAPRVIVLQHGAFLVVSGWIESKADVVLDVEPHLTSGATIAQDEWIPLKDGRLSCSKIPPGRHGLYLSHTSPPTRPCFSEVTFFDIAPGEQKELRLQLFPGRRFEGRFDAAVPRPITHGAVRLNLQVGTPDESAATMSRVFEAPVNSEGMFEFTDLPLGEGGIIGMCDGWASVRVLGESKIWEPRPDGLSAEQQAAIADVLHDRALVPQSVTPGATDATFELRMEPTSSVVATFVDPERHPVAHVTLELWPSPSWSRDDSGRLMERTFVGISDEDGRITVSNVPSGVVKGSVQHERFVLPGGTSAQSAIQLKLAAGETRELRIQLERRKDE